MSAPKCLVMACGNTAEGSRFCALDLARWSESSEARRVDSSDAGSPAPWFTALGDFIRRVEAERLNAGNGEAAK